MPTNTNTNTNRRCAFATEAMMIRALHAYRTARDAARNSGADVSAEYDPPTFEALSDRYGKLLWEFASERPVTISGAMAYLDLVAAIIDGERSEQRGEEGGSVLSVELDFGYALELLASVRRWLNDQDVDELIKEERAKLAGSSLGEAIDLVKAAGRDADLFALIAEFRRQHHEVNTLKDPSDEVVTRLSAELRAVRYKLNKVRPVTLRGVLAVLDLGSLIDDPHYWPAEAIEGLREIAAQEGRS
jgi:hypothetical protein